MNRQLILRCALCVFPLAWAGTGRVVAEAGDDFFRGKTITFITVFAPGGTYDLYGRLVANHLGRFIAGNPRVVVQYLPGAGGLNGAMRLANQSPADGTEIGMVERSLAVNKVLHPEGTPLDVGKFQWIGVVSSYGGIVHVATRGGARTADDLRRVPVVMGSWGVETSSFTLPVLLNALAGTRFKVVTGYRGAAEVDLAVERGEVDGRISSWATLKYAKAAALAEGALAVVLQSGVKRQPDLPRVPLIGEMATSEKGRRILEFIDSDSAVGWSVVAPPATPAERVATLRQAFDRMVADPAFLAEANAKHVDVVPSTGQEVDALIKRTLSIPAEDVAEMKSLIAANR